MCVQNWFPFPLISLKVAQFQKGWGPLMKTLAMPEMLLLLLA